VFIGEEGAEHIEERPLMLVVVDLTSQGLAQALLDIMAQGVWQGLTQQLLKSVQGGSAVALLELHLTQLKTRHIGQGGKRIVRYQALQGL
jgi:hypothetical protein